MVRDINSKDNDDAMDDNESNIKPIKNSDIISSARAKRIPQDTPSTEISQETSPQDCTNDDTSSDIIIFSARFLPEGASTPVNSKTANSELTSENGELFANLEELKAMKLKINEQIEKLNQGKKTSSNESNVRDIEPAKIIENKKSGHTSKVLKLPTRMLLVVMLILMSLGGMVYTFFELRPAEYNLVYDLKGKAGEIYAVELYARKFFVLEDNLREAITHVSKQNSLTIKEQNDVFKEITHDLSLDKGAGILSVNMTTRQPKVVEAIMKHLLHNFSLAYSVDYRTEYFGTQLKDTVTQIDSANINLIKVSKYLKHLNFAKILEKFTSEQHVGLSKVYEVQKTELDIQAQDLVGKLATVDGAIIKMAGINQSTILADQDFLLTDVFKNYEYTLIELKLRRHLFKNDEKELKDIDAAAQNIKKQLLTSINDESKQAISDDIDSDIAVLISRFFLGVRQLTIDLMLYNASPMLQKATFNDAEHASYERQSRELRINLNMLQTERKVLMNEMSEVIDENITMSVTHVNSDQLKPQGQITYWGTMGVCILLLGGAIVLGRKRRNS